MAFGVWSYGVFAVLALLWLRRRSEARRRALILRKRSSRLRLLRFIAAQEEQQKFFLLLFVALHICRLPAEKKRLDQTQES